MAEHILSLLDDIDDFTLDVNAYQEDSGYCAYVEGIVYGRVKALALSLDRAGISEAANDIHALELGEGNLLPVLEILRRSIIPDVRARFSSTGTRMNGLSRGAVLFVSHASADKKLVDELYDLLQTGCDLRRDHILCSSVEGGGIETGADFIKWIDDNLASASIVLLLLTPNYYASKFCLAEMGAAWALKKDIFPLVLPNAPRDPGLVFVSRQAARLDSGGLDDLRDAISQHHRETSRSTARWTIKKEEFLSRVGPILVQLPRPAVVDSGQLDTERERAEAALELYREAEAEVRALRERVALLEKAKDAAEVRQIRAKFDTTAERYDELRKQARRQLDELGRAEVRAIYATVRGEEWWVARDAPEYLEKEIEQAVKSRWLIEHEYPGGQTSYSANDEHPRFGDVFESLSELGSLMDSMREDEKKTIEAEEGYLLDIRNWQYWNEALLYSSLLE